MSQRISATIALAAGAAHAQSNERDKNGCLLYPNTDAQRRDWAACTFRSVHPCPATGKLKGACPGYRIGLVQPEPYGQWDDYKSLTWATEPAK